LFTFWNDSTRFWFIYLILLWKLSLAAVWDLKAGTKFTFGFVLQFRWFTNVCRAREKTRTRNNRKHLKKPHLASAAKFSSLKHSYCPRIIFTLTIYMCVFSSISNFQERPIVCNSNLSCLFAFVNSLSLPSFALLFSSFLLRVRFFSLN